MSLERSPEDLRNLLQNCGVCNNVITSPAYLCKSSCGHYFHKSCYQKFIKTKQICPVCGNKLSLMTTNTLTMNSPLVLPPPMVTRAQAQRVQEHILNNTNPPSTPKSQTVAASEPNISVMSSISPQDQREHIRNLVTAAVGAQQAEMLSTLSHQLTKIIETNIESGFRRISLSQSGNENSRPKDLNTNSDSTPTMRNLPSVEQQTLEQLLGLPSNRDSTGNVQPAASNGRLNSNAADLSHSSDSFFRPDKVGHIIHNWKIRFSGDHKGMSVDNFIYRVEALTTQTLDGNFELLCRHISTLFDSKATEWFWRYHRSVNEIRWPDLCNALRHQYKDSRTDVDFREMIRDRKQHHGESFDSFYDAIVEISDRLSTPLQENVLVEILRRNLLPEIQHEILNIPIYSVTHLRDICRRREFFMMDIGKRQVVNKSINFRRQVHELEQDDIEPLTEEDISAISLICWNCQKNGHRYQDCLEDRNVFCYGCGTPEHINLIAQNAIIQKTCVQVH
ncbi:hypothetical protein CVS40_9622 [Lucilia cuprina]|nr:hypothetical protein CVS40_9622 [Lucilia cuprina]